MSFKSLGLPPWMIDNLKKVAIKTPSAIQQACIPAILEGNYYNPLFILISCLVLTCHIIV